MKHLQRRSSHQLRAAWRDTLQMYGNTIGILLHESCCHAGRALQLTGCGCTLASPAALMTRERAGRPATATLLRAVGTGALRAFCATANAILS